MRDGDFSGASFVVRDPLTGVPVPGQPHSGRPPRSRRRGASSTSSIRCRTSRTLLPAATARIARSCRSSRDRDRADVRIDHELTGRDSLFARVSWQRRDPDAFTFESTGGNGGAGLTNLGLLDRESKAIDARRRLDARSGPARSSTNSAAATARTRAIDAAISSPGDVGAPLGHRGAAAGRRGARLPVVPLFRARTGRRTFATSGRTRSAISTSRRSRSAATSTWLKGTHSIKFGGIYTRNFAKDGYSTGANESKGAYNFSGFATGNAFADFLLGLPNQCASSATRAATCRWTRSRTTGRCSRRTTVKLNSAADAVPRPALRGHRRLRRQERHLRELRPDRRRPSRRAQRRHWRVAAAGRRSSWAARSRRTSSASGAG